MSLRALGYLLTRRFSPRRIPRAQAQVESLPSPRIVSQAAGRPLPARSVHSLRDLDVGNGVYGGVAAAAALSGLAVILFFKKHTAGPVDFEASNGNKDRETPPLDLEARFEYWMKKHGRAYKDKEEEAKRFELFKETVKRLESRMTPPVVPNDFADKTREERRAMTGREPMDKVRKHDEYVNRMIKARQQLSMQKAALQPATASQHARA